MRAEKNKRRQIINKKTNLNIFAVKENLARDLGRV
jgi:hypothetical protein